MENIALENNYKKPKKMYTQSLGGYRSYNDIEPVTLEPKNHRVQDGSRSAQLYSESLWIEFSQDVFEKKTQEPHGMNDAIIAKSSSWVSCLTSPWAMIIDHVYDNLSKEQLDDIPISYNFHKRDAPSIVRNSQGRPIGTIYQGNEMLKLALDEKVKTCDYSPIMEKIRANLELSKQSSAKSKELLNEISKKYLMKGNNEVDSQTERRDTDLKRQCSSRITGFSDRIRRSHRMKRLEVRRLGYAA
mmetsp:Transcript_2731/g.3596  ORF Transcript_2731/g.3596 Transcript_2731/m.3596 type:complete len:244 (+) Transcript_2731:37-768(+)